MTAHDFMIGAPYFSKMIIVENTKKPKPTKRADPQSPAMGAPSEGQMAPTHPEPPAQSLNPDLIRLKAIQRMTGPVTIFGNKLAL